MAKRQWFPFVSRDDHTQPGGVNDACWITTKLYAKGNSVDSPYLIPNEWICGRIASCLCLPIPPFALFRPLGKGAIASLRFSTDQTPPNDTDPVECVKADSFLCVGIVLLDILIANNDRHEGNISVDRPVSPRDIRIFDHDQALFGCRAGKGIERLESMKGRLGVSAGPKSGGNRHVLLDVLNTAQHFQDWYLRFENLPDWYVNDACDSVVKLGTTQKEAGFAAEFLNKRKKALEGIVNQHKKEFKSIRDWRLF